MTTLGTYGAGTYGAGTYGGTAVLDHPTWIVLVSTPAGWLDVTCDVRSITVDAGRSSYVDAFAAASLELELADFAGRYSPFTHDSVWLQAGGFVTGVPIRAGAVLAGAVEWRFTGTTDGVFSSWPGTVDAVAAVSATDGFKSLARFNGGVRAAIGGGELSGARINRLADDARWTAPRKVDAGAVALQATTLDGITLDLMRQVGESEWGWLYVDGTGALVFIGRTGADTRPNMTTVQWTFTDDDALPGTCYGEATVGADETHIINIAAVTPPGLPLSRYENVVSSAWFGPRSWTRTDLPLAATVDAAALAQLVVSYYAFDDRRVDAVEFDAANHAGNYAAGAGVDQTDRIRFVRTIPGGDQLDAELLVLGRRDLVVPAGDGSSLAEWTVTLSTGNALVIVGLGAWDVGTWDESMWGV